MFTMQGTGCEKQVSEAWLSEHNKYNGRTILRDCAQNLVPEVEALLSAIKIDKNMFCPPKYHNDIHYRMCNYAI